MPVMLSAMGSTDTETVVTVRDIQRAVALAEQAVECLESDETRANLLQAAGVGWALLAQLAADSVAGAAGWASRSGTRRTISAPTSTPRSASLYSPRAPG